MAWSARRIRLSIGSWLPGLRLAIPIATVWFALRTESSVFVIVDAFASDEDRGKHLGGDIAKALMAKAGELLSEPPKIEKADVLASKVRA